MTPVRGAPGGGPRPLRFVAPGGIAWRTTVLLLGGILALTLFGLRKLSGLWLRASDGSESGAGRT